MQSYIRVHGRCVNAKPVPCERSNDDGHPTHVGVNLEPIVQVRPGIRPGGFMLHVGYARPLRMIRNPCLPSFLGISIRIHARLRCCHPTTNDSMMMLMSPAAIAWSITTPYKQEGGSPGAHFPRSRARRASALQRSVRASLRAQPGAPTLSSRRPPFSPHGVLVDQLHPVLRVSPTPTCPMHLVESLHGIVYKSNAYY